MGCGLLLNPLDLSDQTTSHISQTTSQSAIIKQMIDRDRDADKLALAGGLGILPFAAAILGSWLWPLFNSAGNPVHQEYKLTEILTGFVLFGAIGMVLGAVLLWVRAKTEQPDENGGPPDIIADL